MNASGALSAFAAMLTEGARPHRGIVTREMVRAVQIQEQVELNRLTSVTMQRAAELQAGWTQSKAVAA